MLNMLSQTKAVEGFLQVLRKYCTESLCKNLRAHTITNVQSNNDKVKFSILVSLHALLTNGRDMLIYYTLSFLKRLSVCKTIHDHSV